MHHADRIDDMQADPSEGADIGVGQRIVIVRIGVGDAAALFAQENRSIAGGCFNPKTSSSSDEYGQHRCRSSRR